METWFLILSLFFPRITLFIAYCSGQIPANNIPFWGDFFMAIVIPRLLVLLYIDGNLGVGAWFWAHVVAGCIAIVYHCIKDEQKRFLNK